MEAFNLTFWDLNIVHFERQKNLFFVRLITTAVKFQVQLMLHHAAGEWLRPQSLTVKFYDHL